MHKVTCAYFLYSSSSFQAKSCPSLKKQLQAIYQALVAKTDSDGRVVSELFVKRPSAKQYPEYYIVIQKPIDLKEILAKIKSEQV